MNKKEFQDPDSASGKQNDWISVCASMVEDASFAKFRSNDVMCSIVEGSPKRAGQWNLRRLRRNIFFRDYVTKFSTSDKFGKPKNLIKFKCNKEYFEMSPTTLRYVNNIMNIIDLFGKNALIPSNENIIVEIGGGYGGECKIANDLASKFFRVNRNLNWSIFDLKSSELLISRWLNTFNYKASLNPDVDSFKSISLVISNAAFSEMERELQEKYFNEIILKAETGYFIENFGIFSGTFGGFSRKEFITRLENAGKFVVSLESRLWLSDFDNDAGTGLIVFSTNKPLNYRERRMYLSDKVVIFKKLCSSLVLSMRLLMSRFFARNFSNHQ